VGWQVHGVHGLGFCGIILVNFSKVYKSVGVSGVAKFAVSLG